MIKPALSILLIMFSVTVFYSIKLNTLQVNVEDRFIKYLFNLPRVKQQQVHLTKIKGSKVHVAVMITEKPSASSPYYVAQVGYSSNIRFEVYDNYRIEPKYLNQADFLNKLQVLNLDGNFVKMKSVR